MGMMKGLIARWGGETERNEGADEACIVRATWAMMGLTEAT